MVNQLGECLKFHSNRDTGLNMCMKCSGGLFGQLEGQLTMCDAGRTYVWWIRVTIGYFSFWRCNNENLNSVINLL